MDARSLARCRSITQPIRMLKSAIKYREIELMKPLDDAGVLQVITSEVKRRRDSVEVPGYASELMRKPLPVLRPAEVRGNILACLAIRLHRDRASFVRPSQP